MRKNLGGFIMKTFFKDYKDLLKANGEFCKKHWKGCLVIEGIAFVSPFIVYGACKVKDKVKEKFSTKKEA